MFFRLVFPVFLSCLVLLSVSTGCVDKKRLPPIPDPSAEISVPDLLHQADRAWQAGDYPRSRRLYERLVVEPLEPGQQSLVWERLALSALRTREYAQAQDALIRWALHDPSLRAQWDWHEFRVQALLGLDRWGEAEEYLLQLMQQPQSAWSLRFSAGIRLSELYRQQEALEPLRMLFARLHAVAPAPQDRIQLEQVVARIAKDLSDETLLRLVEGVPADDLTIFPNSVFFWELNMREAQRRPEAWPDIWLSLQRLLQKGEWTDPAPFSSELDQLEEHLGAPGLCLGLVLPLDGSLVETGWKILRGAEAARQSLLDQGFSLRLEIVNSQSAVMLEQLAEMDAECAIIGGPIQRETWDRVHAAGLTSQRHFFAFLPSMGDVQEGRQAWRFFGSPEDQTRALAALAIDRLGITDMAVLFPQDRFGEHMRQVFTTAVVQQGGRVNTLQSYSPTDHSAWGDSVASLLNVPAGQRRGRQETLRLPDPPFQALFIPDSLRQAEMLLPHLFYYDEQRLLILGPELWSQSWGQRPEQIETQYFRLAVMPGAWWPNNPVPAARALTAIAEAAGIDADLWIALGYDFVRFMAELGHGSSTRPPHDLNALLAGLNDFQWSMAPLSWDEQGRVRQAMFLFQPTSQGPTILDPEALRFQLERVRTRFAR